MSSTKNISTFVFSFCDDILSTNVLSVGVKLSLPVRPPFIKELLFTIAFKELEDSL